MFAGWMTVPHEGQVNAGFFVSGRLFLHPPLVG
jgi:hypothetical protein